MSNYNIIADIGETLKKLLWEHFLVDNNIYPQIIDSEDLITLASPEEMDNVTPKKLSLFLYQIVENSFMKNQEMAIVNTDTLQYPPLILDLIIMVTCNTDDRRKDHILLGKVMQVFHDHAVLKGSILQGSLSGSQDEFRIVYYTLPFEETIQIWQSFSETSFKLSVCYRITPIKVDSTRQKEISRVLER